MSWIIQSTRRSSIMSESIIKINKLIDITKDLHDIAKLVY